MLDLDRVEVVRVQARQSEDGRSDLGGLDHGVAGIDRGQSSAGVGLGIAVDAVGLRLAVGAGAVTGVAEQEVLREARPGPIVELDQHAVVIDREGDQVARVTCADPGGVQVIHDRVISDTRQRRGGLRH